MKCPKCGQEMELGWLHAGRGPLFWSRKKNKLTIFLGQDDLRLQGMFGGTLPAWLCVDCQMVLMTYDQQE
ncbi:PF20097 family protein [Flavonifractor hominis]|uniref:PF20097 family protein n=1 Tax=Flavonifractor hominis TaxID=3133178 RepID=A0ABV1EPM1_9FIRM